VTKPAQEATVRKMPSLARSSIAPILGQRVPLRGPARLLHRSYAKAAYQPGGAPLRLTSKLGDVFDIDLSSFLEWQIWAFGSFEEHFAELFRQLVKKGERCIDVGANVGVHTVRLGKLVGPFGEVTAIEPDPDVARRNRANVALNQLNNVRVIEAAASDHEGDSVQLYRPDDRDSNRARASMRQHEYLTGEAVSVPTVTVDGISDKPVALIKIDVEGCESAVISGAAQTIRRYRPSIVYEYAPDILADKADSPFSQLRDSGYELFQILQKRNSVTGRGGLELRRLRAMPQRGGDILAVSGAMTGRLNCPIR
jgi:FkbM family methyltransferase